MRPRWPRRELARFAAAAPDLAGLCRSRLEEPGVALLGTLRLVELRRDPPVEGVEVYAFQLTEAIGIEWDIDASRMVVDRWTPSAGETVTARAYP